MANEYSYVDTQGVVKTVTAPDWQTAIKTAPNIAKTSGVMLNKPASETPQVPEASNTKKKSPKTETSLGESSSLFEALNPYLSNNKRSDSYLKEIERAEEARARALRSKIKGQYDLLEQEETERGVADTASREGQLARIGGGAPDTRFSSAAFGFIQAAKDASTKRMTKLQIEESNALANLDIQSAERIREARYKELDRQDRLEEQRFDRIMGVLGLNIQMKASDRAERAFDLDLMKSLKDVPAGQEITINGQTYKGLGKTGETKLYQTTVVEGGVRREKVFGINEETGEKVFSTDLGAGIMPAGDGGVTDKRFTASNIPPDLMAELATDVQAIADGDATVAEIYVAYPEVSPSFINSLINPTLRYGG